MDGLKVCDGTYHPAPSHSETGLSQLCSLELFGASIKLIGSSPSAIRWETDTFGSPTPLAGSTRGHPSAWRSSGRPLVRPPRGPFPPLHPEYCVGLGTARRRQLAEAGAGLPVRSTTARAQPLAAAATQVCLTPQRGCEGCPPGLRPRLPSVMPTCRRAVGDTCGNSDRQGKRAGRAWGPRARSPAKAQALRGAGL